MSRKFLILFVFLIFIGGLLSSQEPTQKRGVRPVEPKKEENKNQKIALVIGNASYKESPLKNPVNDAIDTADVLKKCGFEVILKTNANQLHMEKAVREFSDRLKDGGIGLFYFSGHGVRVEGINYLIPVGSNIHDESDMKSKAVSANYILGKMDRGRNGMNIMILDACRNNPYIRSFRSPKKGLAMMDAPEGSLIVYATSPGKTAADGPGRNGIYTYHLLKMIKNTNFEIMLLLRKVRKNVMDETYDKQIPWESSSLLGNFYFFFIDKQLEKLKAENLKLQSEIKDLERQIKEFEKIKAEEEIREAARKEEELKIILKAKLLEEEILLKAKEIQERLEQEEKRLAQEWEEKMEKRARERAAVEERLRKLREELDEKKRKLKIIKKEVMSIDTARKEVEMLEAKIKNIVSIVTQKKGKALKQLEGDYNPIIEKLKNKPIPPKDQFETTADYEARAKKHQANIEALEKSYKADYKDIQNKYENEITIRTKIYKDQINELKNRKYTVERLKVELLNYNPDNELYHVKLTDAIKNHWYYHLSIDRVKAKRLYGRKEWLKAEGYYPNLEDTTFLLQVVIIDPILGKLSPMENVYKNSAGYGEAYYRDGIVMVYIPPGEFTMGSNDGDYDERPSHAVYLDGYWIGKYEVTFDQYDRYCEETKKKKPDDNGWGRGKRPVINVSWDDANAYCDWLSEKTGLRFKLPTEAQWEKAARGTDGHKYPWGNHDPYYSGKYYANHYTGKDEVDGYIYTAPVGSYPHGASSYGLLDMAGNVWEWCSDWYDNNYYRNARQENPTGPKSGSIRVIRGGSWEGNVRSIRSAWREDLEPFFLNSSVGFRLCQDIK